MPLSVAVGGVAVANASHMESRNRFEVVGRSTTGHGTAVHPPGAVPPREGKVAVSGYRLVGANEGQYAARVVQVATFGILKAHDVAPTSGGEERGPEETELGHPGTRRTGQWFTDRANTPGAILRATRGSIEVYPTFGRLDPTCPRAQLGGPRDVHKDSRAVVHRLTWLFNRGGGLGVEKLGPQTLLGCVYQNAIHSHRFHNLNGYGPDLSHATGEGVGGKDTVLASVLQDREGRVNNAAIGIEAESQGEVVVLVDAVEEEPVVGVGVAIHRHRQGGHGLVDRVIVFRQQHGDPIH